MSAVVKLSSKMPGDPETNGVDAQAVQLVDDPEQLRCAVIWYDAGKVTIDTDSGDHIPTIRVRRIEPIGNVEAVPSEVQRLVAEAVEKRTGRTPLPFDTAEVREELDYDGDAD